MTDSSELCLFQITPSSLEELHTSTSTKQNPIDNLVMTATWMELRPTLLVYCKAKECGSFGLEASSIKAMYFMFAFHSSVWSLILLFTLVVSYFKVLVISLWEIWESIYCYKVEESVVNSTEFGRSSNLLFYPILLIKPRRVIWPSVNQRTFHLFHITHGYWPVPLVCLFPFCDSLR